jgi:hypothetical protein
MNEIEFPRNYSDLSTNQGFQFEFHCDRCGAGYRTRFQPSTLGTVSSVLDAAGSLFGGVFGRAADLGQRARSATWEMAHDNAFLEAVQELKADFVQCPRCSSWVCQKSCWNTGKGLCKTCAPDLGVEMAAAQASRTVDEIRTHSQVAEEDQKMLVEESWREGIRATCPECNTPLAANVKFCPQCGAGVEAKHCSQCGAKLDPTAKFCGECGTKV